MSWRFLVDEDMPRSTARTLREAGYVADDARDVGLRGRTDQEVFAYAQANGAILVSADKGFANLFVFPPATHAGIVVVRVPDTLPTATVNQELLRALSNLAGTDLAHTLVVIEPGRARIRR